MPLVLMHTICTHPQAAAVATMAAAAAAAAMQPLHTHHSGQALQAAGLWDGSRCVQPGT